MSAKLAYSLADENQKQQIGCINGLFQLFDRHQSGRRANTKRLPPPGTRDSDILELKNAPEKVMGKDPKKAGKDNPRLSTESSIMSYSSSTCSSTFSSLECNKTCIPEPSSTSHASYTETASRHLPPHKVTGSPQSDRQSFGIQAAVKDSINREAGNLSVRTMASTKVTRKLRHIDSPRPMHPSQPVTPQILSLDETLLRRQEASYGHNNRKDAHRFSYDGRESQYKLKSSLKLKEFPRLSLDSKASSMKGSGFELKSNYNGNCNGAQTLQRELGSGRRPSSVVAKLMGLEVPIDFLSIRADENLLISPEENHIYGFSHDCQNGSISTQPQTANSNMKPTRPTRTLTKPAPQKHVLTDKSRGSGIAAFKCDVLQPAPNHSPSVYGELEKQVADLQFKRRSKDLGALKQIVEAMQKPTQILEFRKEDQVMDSAPPIINKNSKCNKLQKPSNSAEHRSLQGNTQTYAVAKGSAPQKSPRFPTAVRSTKVERNAFSQATLTSPIEGLSGLRRLQTRIPATGRKELGENLTAKDRTPRNSYPSDPSSLSSAVTAKNINFRTSRTEHSAAESPISSGRTSATVSPRLQQNQQRLERRTRQTKPSIDSNRPKRQTDRRSTEGESPGRQMRTKSLHSEQLRRQSSDVRGCDSQSDSNVSLSSQNDTEVTSIDHSAEICEIHNIQNSKRYTNQSAWSSKETCVTELTTSTTEQPSPVSVLDAMFYSDESPSPVKKISNAFTEADESLYHEEPWSVADTRLNSPCTESSTECTPFHCNEKNIDYSYIYEILSASGFLRDYEYSFATTQLHQSEYVIDPKLFFVLEQNKPASNLRFEYQDRKKNSSPVYNKKVQRKLLFDAVNEILVHKAFSALPNKPWILLNELADRKQKGDHLLGEVRSEIEKLQMNHSEDEQEKYDMVTIILREDLRQQPQNWTDFHGEMSRLVLDIERLIFKDLINELITGGAANSKGRPAGHRYSN